MHTLDLTMAPSSGLAVLPVAGPASGCPETGFHLLLCYLDVDGPQPVQLPSGVAEQVFYVMAGSGVLRQGERRTQLQPMQAYRVPADAPVELERQGTVALELLYMASPLPALPSDAEIACLEEMEGITFPAGRWGRSITQGGSPIKTAGFTAGLSLLAPRGGQVPWHHHPDRQFEVYLLLGGRPQMCVGADVHELAPPAAAFIPGDQWHQLTNLHPDMPLQLIYCYEGSVAAPHWWQERDGVLPPAGAAGNPSLPAGAFPQCTQTDAEAWARRAGDHLPG